MNVAALLRFDFCKCPTCRSPRDAAIADLREQGETELADLIEQRHRERRKIDGL